MTHTNIPTVHTFEYTYICIPLYLWSLWSDGKWSLRPGVIHLRRGRTFSLYKSLFPIVESKSAVE